jgi:hypothetical protein
MEYKISYGTWSDKDGTIYRQRLNVEMTAKEFLSLNEAIIRTHNSDHNKYFYLRNVGVGDNYTTITTADFIADYLGRTDRYKDDRNSVVKITLTDADDFIPTSEFERGEDRIFRLRKIGHLFVGAVSYGLRDELFGLSAEWIHFEPLSGLRMFIWFDEARFYTFGMLCAKKRISARVLKKR